MSANKPARRSPDRSVFRFRGQYFTRADFIRMAGLSFVALLFPEKVKAFSLPNMFWKSTATCTAGNSGMLTTGTTWTVPSACSSVPIELWGGGGGGGRRDGSVLDYEMGGGGGGGAYCAKTLALSPGTVISYAIGGGGGSEGGGGNTTVTAHGLTAGGGGPGVTGGFCFSKGCVQPGPDGTGGTATGGTTNTSGANGSSGNGGSGGGGGGAGGGYGQNGTAPGGGGAGGELNYSNGHTGGSGRIKFTYS